MTEVGLKRVRPLPSVERVRDLIAYDPINGSFTWKVSRPGRWQIKAGDIAGTFRPDGYRIITIDGTPCTVQRVAWVIMTGEWPDRIVDHIDTDPRNNRWNNYRLADGSQSAANKGVPSNNTTGYKGIRERKG